MFQAIPIQWCRNGSTAPGTIEKYLPEAHQVSMDCRMRFCGRLLDTFAGHVRRAGKLLVQQPGRVVLVQPAEGSVVEQAVSNVWKFAAELGDGPVGFQLLELSRLRAFRPLVDVAVEVHLLEHRDELGKTVVRASVLSVAVGDSVWSWLTIRPMRGYDAEHKQLNIALEKSGFMPVERAADFFPVIGNQQPPYESKPRVELDADAPVFESACVLVRTFLHVARRNEAGILADTDTEFLHDYRVSLRRVRSLLSLLGGVFNKEENARLRRELAAVMQQTNALRDLDVYLLDRDRFYQLVPPSMHGGLDIMFAVFSSERQAAFEQVCSALRNPEYGMRMDALTAWFGEQPAMPPGKSADEPGKTYAGRIMLKRYRKVARIAGKITPDTPDETVHDLRIQCKKLRYLMEFFAPLFPSGELRPLVKALKGLQDVLGRFNDCSVQRERLGAFVGRHPMRGKKGLRLAESVGALTATLYQLQLKSRAEVVERMDRFVNPKTLTQFKQVFAKKAVR